MTLDIEDTKRNHITLKKFYRSEVKDKSLTRIFRPGNRECPNEKCYFGTQKVFIKILDIGGSDYHKIEPIHLKEKYPVEIINSKCLKLKDLKKLDFKNCGSDLKNIETLKSHLGLIYNLEKSILDDKNFEITITDFKYL